jgi:hypothetical protein
LLVNGVRQCHFGRLHAGTLPRIQIPGKIGVDFLDFLRSGEKDIHAFAESRCGRRRRSSANEPTAPPGDSSAEQ